MLNPPWYSDSGPDNRLYPGSTIHEQRNKCKQAKNFFDLRGVVNDEAAPAFYYKAALDESGPSD
jgi:hypothetical protein